MHKENAAAAVNVSAQAARACSGTYRSDIKLELLLPPKDHQPSASIVRVCFVLGAVSIGLDCAGRSLRFISCCCHYYLTVIYFHFSAIASSHFDQINRHVSSH